jgi:DNA-binding NarL/FixJ family response regulator
VATPVSVIGVSVVVADANPVVARGLAGVLADAAAEVLALAADADGALIEVARKGPRVLLVSLDLPSKGSGHVVAIARERWPQLGIVTLSSRHDDEAVLVALKLGASSHLRQLADPAQIVAATAHAADAPNAFMSCDLMGSPRRIRDSQPGLTPRELEVLRLAGQGLTVREVSARLFVSDATTRTHLAGIYRKLRVSNRSQAVLSAERLGLLR